MTRGHGRVEVALGFLFSSPNFNPVVVMMMTFMALPLAMSLTKYAVLLLVILVVVPALIRWLERDKPLQGVHRRRRGDILCDPAPPSTIAPSRSGPCFEELAADYGKHVWMLLKPTITLMLLASVVSAAVLTLIPGRRCCPK